jgi:orotate phosphoribosyltransferase
MEMLETKKATKTEFYFQKIQTLFLLVVQPKWKGKKKLKSKRASQSYIQKNKTKQNPQTKQSAQRASQSRWYKRKKQFANLVTPKDLID